MTRSGKSSRDDQLNVSTRKAWAPKDGDGAEGLDFAEYKYFNPTEKAVEKLLKFLTPAMISEGEATKHFPRRVRLSDSAMGVVITIGVTIAKSRDYWPLNFNAAGYAIAEPALRHFGHAFKVNGSYAEFGKDENSCYLLAGEAHVPPNSTVILISRPSSKQKRGYAPSLKSDSPALQANPSPHETPHTPSKAPKALKAKPDETPHTASKALKALKPKPDETSESSGAQQASKEIISPAAKKLKTQATPKNIEAKVTSQNLAKIAQQGLAKVHDASKPIHSPQERLKYISSGFPYYTGEGTTLPSLEGIRHPGNRQSEAHIPSRPESSLRPTLASLEDIRHLEDRQSGARTPLHSESSLRNPTLSGLKDIRHLEDRQSEAYTPSRPGSSFHRPTFTSFAGEDSPNLDEAGHPISTGFEEEIDLRNYHISSATGAGLQGHGYYIDPTSDTAPTVMSTSKAPEKAIHANSAIGTGLQGHSYYIDPTGDTAPTDMSASKAPGKAIPLLSPSPPPKGKGKGVATMNDVLEELRDTNIALVEAMRGHTKAVTTAERLDAITVSQSEGLRAAARMIKLLKSRNPQLTKEEEQSVLSTYDSIKTSFNTGAGIRDGLREDLTDLADAGRIFEHDDQLGTPQSTSEWAQGAMEAENISEWYAGQEWTR